MTALGFWLPVTVIGFASLGAPLMSQMQSVSPPAAITGVIVTMIVWIWGAGSLKSSMIARISALEEKFDSAITKLVTHDALQLKLYEERQRNDDIYVKAKDCDHQHDKLNGLLERAAEYQRHMTKGNGG